MIPVQDLCIGNWVYDGKRTQFPMFVQAIGEDYVYLNFEGNEADPWETTPEELEGIPLTEELLEKMGFKDTFNGEKTLYSMMFKVSDKRHISISVCLDCGSVSVADMTKTKFPEVNVRLCSYTTNTKFLHELQNFIFLTTKQQLKVNL